MIEFIISAIPKKLSGSFFKKQLIFYQKDFRIQRNDSIIYTSRKFIIIFLNMNVIFTGRMSGIRIKIIRSRMFRTVFLIRRFTRFTQSSSNNPNHSIRMNSIMNEISTSVNNIFFWIGFPI